MLSRVDSQKYHQREKLTQQTVDFIKQHINFFCAPMDPFMVKIFQEWAKSHEEKIKPLSDEIWLGLNSTSFTSPFSRTFVKYRKVLFALRDGSQQEIFEFIFKEFPRMISIIGRHKEDAIFDLWNTHLKENKYQLYAAAIKDCRQQLAIAISQCVSRETEIASIARDYSLKINGPFAVTLPEKEVNRILDLYKKHIKNKNYYLSKVDNSDSSDSSDSSDISDEMNPYSAKFFQWLSWYAFFLKAETLANLFDAGIYQEFVLRKLYQHFACNLEIFTQACGGRFLEFSNLMDRALVNEIIHKQRLKSLSNFCFNLEQCHRIKEYILLMQDSEFNTFVEFLEDSWLKNDDTYPFYVEAYVRIIESYLPDIQSMQHHDFLVFLDEKDIDIETYLAEVDKTQPSHLKRKRPDQMDVADGVEPEEKKQKIENTVGFFSSRSTGEVTTKLSDLNRQLFSRRQG